MPFVAAEDRAVDEQFRRVLRFMLATGIVLLAINFYMAGRSGSLSVVAILLDGGLALLLDGVTYYALTVIDRANVYQFPHGTGKIENFIGFFHGCSILMVSGAIGYFGIQRIHAASAVVSLGLAQATLVLSVVRDGIVLGLIRRVRKQQSQPSPIVRAYDATYLSSIWYQVAAFLALGLGWLFFHKRPEASLWIDLAVAGGLTSYLATTGYRVVRENFGALLDLPLPEEAQLKILRTLFERHERYEDIVNLYSRSSGRQQILIVELSFRPGTTAGAIESLRADLYKALREALGPVEFSLVTRCESDHPEACDTAASGTAPIPP
jgi:cation diffusion facilitator family transporter